MGKLTMKELEAKLIEMQKLMESQGVQMPMQTATQDDYIDFESLSLVPLYLHTDTVRSGKSDVYSFEKYGEIISIPLVDAKAIVRHNKSFVRNGLVYIKNEAFVAKENLKPYYTNLLDADGIMKLSKGKRKDFDVRFTQLNKTQQDIVCGLLFDRLKDGKKVDDEVLYYINQYSNRDLKTEAANFQLLVKNEEK